MAVAEDIAAVKTRGPKYEQILLSAIDVFSESGYEKATTATLAHRAGVAEGTLYKYFPSKKELFLRCCRYVEEMLLLRYRALYEEVPDRPLEYLKRVAVSYMEFLNENPGMRKFLAQLLNCTFDEEFRDEIVGFLTLNVDATERFIRRAIKKGELESELDPRAAAWIFVGSYFTLIMMVEVEVSEAQDARFVENLISALFQRGGVPGREERR